MTCMDLETVIMSEIHQTDKDTSYNITYVWNLKNGTNEFIFKTEVESQMQKKVIVTKMKMREGRDKLGDWY